MGEQKDPEVIYLMPRCMEDIDAGRMWCEDPIECPDCGAKPTKYVRANVEGGEEGGS